MTEREQDRLLIFSAAELARRHRAAGRELVIANVHAGSGASGVAIVDAALQRRPLLPAIALACAASGAVSTIAAAQRTALPAGETLSFDFTGSSPPC